MNAKYSLVTLLVLSLFVRPEWVLGAQFQSSEFRTPLIELYTSEGCSSCPPADRWISNFIDDEKLWREFVPVAFHVDYWDYIGWKDKFAKPSYGARQKLYARQGGSKAVYTPGVRKAGQLWNGWRLPHSTPSLEDTKVGLLQLSVNEENEFSASFTRAAKRKADRNLTLTVAILGLGLETDVKRGENRGKLLKQDFVVLELLTLNSNNDRWQGSLPTTDIKAPQYAIAAWLSSKGQLKPIQATGGFISKPLLKK